MMEEIVWLCDKALGLKYWNVNNYKFSLNVHVGPTKQDSYEYH